MSDSKMNILVLYACSEYPFRRTFKSFLESFQKYSDHNITYVNYPFFFPKISLSQVEWDIIIYTHSFTAPWNRDRYLKKIENLNNLGLNTRRSIALFQDEYFNLDLTNLFIEKLKIDHVYSVVPESEWHKVYPNVSKENITQYLTGYIETEDIEYAEKLLNETTKDLDISYRTAYPGSQMAALGNIGWLKFEIAEFGNKLNLPSSDIQVGTGFLTGNEWFKLLARSRFSLGVPSGANVLDWNGAIAEELKQLHGFSRAETEEYFANKNIRSDYKLEVISPRIFEAGFLDCCQILVEGEYNNLLKKDVHYIPVDRNLQNLDEVRKKILDKQYVSQIVKNFKKDIIKNEKLTYKFFINDFFSKHSPAKNILDARNQYAVNFSIKLGIVILYIYQFKKKLMKG